MIALLDQFRQGDRRRGTWRRDIARRSNWEGKKEGRREDRLEATVFHRARRGFLNEERSFGSLIYTAAKLKRMRRPGPRLQISAGSSARRRVSHARKKRTRIPRGKERGDYIVIREECWLDPSAGRVLALLPSPEPSWNSLSLFPPLSLFISLTRPIPTERVCLNLVSSRVHRDSCETLLCENYLFFQNETLFQRCLLWAKIRIFRISFQFGYTNTIRFQN